MGPLASGRVDVVPRRSVRFSSLALTLGLAASVGAAACGGGGAGPAAVERAFDRTIAAGTARFTVDAAASALGQSIAQSGQGTVDFTANKVETTTTRASAADPKGDGSTPAPARQIVIGNDVWLSVPPSLVQS